MKRESDKLREELALFVKKMQLAGIRIESIKKPISAANANRLDQTYVTTV